MFTFLTSDCSGGMGLAAEVCPTYWVGVSQLQSVVQRVHLPVVFKLAMRGGTVAIS